MNAPDTLTSLHEHLDEIVRQFYTSLGVLQRDAPPVAVDKEVLLSATSCMSDMDVPQSSKMLAGAVVESIRRFNDLVDALPATEGLSKLSPDWNEAGDLERFKELESENSKAASELRELTEGTETWLNDIQSTLRQVSEDHLKQQH
eukprot:Rmarinus@m.19163